MDDMSKPIDRADRDAIREMTQNAADRIFERLRLSLPTSEMATYESIIEDAVVECFQRGRREREKTLNEMFRCGFEAGSKFGGGKHS
jgi:hypothetical protein